MSRADGKRFSHRLGAAIRPRESSGLGVDAALTPAHDLDDMSGKALAHVAFAYLLLAILSWLASAAHRSITIAKVQRRFTVA